MVALLYANDKRGAYPNSWYASTTPKRDALLDLTGHEHADVCVIGAGYTGLSAALHLAETGRSVILIDAQRVGFGASGRNGGQLGTGQRADQTELEKLVGLDDARKLWDLGEDAKSLVKDLIKTHNIDCYYKPGVAAAASTQSDVDDLHRYADHVSKTYDHTVEQLDQAAFSALCPSPDYKGGVVDRTAGHLHPLRFAFGLADAAIAAGVRIYEHTEAHHIDYTAPAHVRTSKGTITAEHVILATNGYSQSLARPVAARVMPINNFIVATDPLHDSVADVLTEDIAVADSRFVVNYFRLTHDGRLLFGGGESYGYKFPKNIEATVRKPLNKIFPTLKDTRIAYAWGGTLAITMRRMPYLTKVAPNVLSASGYSGHGVGTATHAGQLMARVIQGESDGFDVMARVPASPFPGGPAFKSPLLSLAMTWYALRDRIGF